MRQNFLSQSPFALLFMILFVSMDGVCATVAGQIRAKLDEVEVLMAEYHSMGEQRHKVFQETFTTADRERELQMQKQIEEYSRKMIINRNARLRLLGEAVERLSNYRPTNLSEREAVTEQTKSLVLFIKEEREIILGDPSTPDELVSELGIDKLLQTAVNHLDSLGNGKPVLPEPLPPDDDLDKIKDHPQEPESEKGFLGWLERQEAGVKAALIAAVASFFGALARDCKFFCVSGVLVTVTPGHRRES